MKRRLNVNLNLFEGAAGGGGAGAAAGAAAGGGAGAAGAAAAGVAAGAAEGAEAAGTAEGAGENEGAGKDMTPEQRQEEYNRWKETYKDLYQKDVRSQVKRGYRENQKLLQQIESYTPLLDLLGTKYGVQSGKVEDIIEAIDKDHTFFEEQALKAGMPVETYKNFVRMQAQNNQLLEAQRRAENLRQKQDTYARWDRESEECARKYPGFDFEREAENPEFSRLLGSGASVMTAYQACHFDELMQGMALDTERVTKKQVADTIRAGAFRPEENAVSGTPAGEQKVDFMAMSSSEFRKYREDLLAGRKKI